MTVNQSLSALRQEMSDAQIDAYIIPSSDPHQSEYAASHWLSRQWISGFTGSAGTAIVTHDHAGLWTDVRYFLQAEHELSTSSFELHKMNQFAPSYVQWLADELQENAAVGIDGFNFSVTQARSMEKTFSSKSIKLVVNKDLISKVWSDRPSLPSDTVFIHPEKYQGDSMANRIESVQKTLNTNEHLLVTALDDIAWLLHLRGRDVECNPVAIAYVIVGKTSVDLFINPSKVPQDVMDVYTANGVQIKEYTSLSTSLQAINANDTVVLDPSICSIALYDMISSSIHEEGSIIRSMKAIKNDKEINHIREAMIKDGVALTKAFIWLENNLGNEEISEYAFAQKIAGFRSDQAVYFGESFSAIVGYKGNGAIIHYHPTSDKSDIIQKSGVLLCDSGGQYYDGTTDITRTIALHDDVPKEAKVAYTAVLKGMIALDMAIYPVGTIGGQLDVLARKYLWDLGLNYGHGTGHGVGYFLNVHEPPQGFAPGLTSSRATSALEIGMITSNEPGFYKEGEYGIRIENCIVTKAHSKEGYLCHESLTMFPIDHAMMKTELLTTEEIAWLNDYHTKVYSLLSGRLNEEEKIWLKAKCASI